MSRFRQVFVCAVLSAVWIPGQPAAGADPGRPAIEAKPLQSRELADFTKARAAKSVAPEHPGLRVAAAPGGKGLRIDFPKQEPFPSAILWQAVGKGDDWSAFDYLRLSVTNTGKVRTTPWFYLHDVSAAQDPQRGEFGLGVDPGQRVEVAIPLGLVYRADRPGLVDLARMSKLRVAFERQAEPGQVVLDRLTLVKVFDGPKPFFFFDFYGGGHTPVAGTLPVTPKSQYTKEVGYGFTSLKELTATMRASGKFPVFGDAVNGTNIPFAVDVPDGKYEVQVIAMAYTWDGVRCFNYSIDAEGKRAVDVPLSEDLFYSGQGLYWGIDKFHDPARTMWQQYGRDYFKPHVFQADVSDGQLNLDFNGCAVYAAWIYPADQAAAGRARVEAIQGEQDWRVHTSIARLAEAPDAGGPREPDAEAKARGYVLFARHYTLMVYPNRHPRPEELARKLSLCATPGEYEPTTFAIRPLKDLKNVTVEVSDLAGPGGAVLPKAAVKVDLVKYFPLKTAGINYTLTPSYLFPYRPLDLHRDFNRQYWLTVHLPQGQPPGAYAGKVRIQGEGGAAGELALEVRVYPFRLAESPKEHGFFNSRAPNYQVVRLFPDKSDALARQVIDAELADMIAHGATGNTLPSPALQSVDKDGGNLKLDWTEARLFVERIKKHGLDKYDHITGSGNVVPRLLKMGFKEFGPEFNGAYKDLVSQSAAFWKEQGIKAVFQVIDEPRETELNEWNRNRVDTVKYLRLAREAGGARTMVTPMGDTDLYGNHYTVMIPLMDVWATHCWPNSLRGIYLCGKEKLADLWFYNNGLDRFQWGFHLWKSAALADFEWVYAWEARGAPPLIDDVIGIGDNVVPYAKGVLPKINYEWAREGVDDLRYVATLEKTIAEAPKEGPAAQAAKEAQAFLGSLRKFLPDYPETELVTGAEAGAKYTEGGLKNYFDPWRRQIAEFIMAIRGGTPAGRIEEAWAPLPRRASDQTKTAVCLLVGKGPAVDGKLDDDAWKNAPVSTGFISVATGELSPLRTEVRIVSDSRKIYFAFRCVEPKYGELKAYATERDANVWEDDAVEVFLDTRHDKKTYYQVIVNTLGTIQDGDAGDPTWNGDVQVAVRKGKGFWDAEMAVGLGSMKAKVGPDVTWGLNLCRDRQVEPRENSSWAYVGPSFHNAAKFGVLKFQKKN